MPHVLVKMAEEHSAAEKQDLTDRIARAVADALGSRPEEISVAVQDVPREAWMEAVYMPDIAGAAELLTRRPGYGPLAANS